MNERERSVHKMGKQKISSLPSSLHLLSNNVKDGRAIERMAIVSIPNASLDHFMMIIKFNCKQMYRLPILRRVPVVRADQQNHIKCETFWSIVQRQRN